MSRPVSGADAVAAMRSMAISGLSVTMPHKSAVVTALDHLRPAAAKLGVVNTIGWVGPPGSGSLVGDSTDGTGFVASLVEDEGFEPERQKMCGPRSGRATRAVTMALSDAGAGSVSVVGRNPSAVGTCAALAGGRGTAVSPDDRVALEAELLAAELLVRRDAGRHAR